MGVLQPIAVVGIGAVFPQAPTLQRFWENIRAAASAAREVPEGRWALPIEQVYDATIGRIDHVYSTRGCFIEGFRFDPRGLSIDPEQVARLDPVYPLTLHAGRQAFEDAKTETLDRDRVGVIIGNIALPTEKSSELAWEILGRSFEEKVVGHAEPHDPVEPLNRYVTGLPAGILARALGLGGGSAALDAACASSLYAVKLSIDELRAGRADAMLTGGVSRPDCLYTQMGFSQLRALSPTGTCSPFDARADGIVVGEGAGIFLLKRLEDALSAGDRIYAVIRAVGLSNDVEGNLLAPSSEGQLRAMRAAYAQAGWSPHDVDLVECHATGTPVGDAVEFESLRTLWEGSGSCVIGSVKSNVGHLLTGAGAAGLMKVLLAMKERTLPPTANFRNSSLVEHPFEVLSEARSWERRSEDTPRRAAVSGFGFGGINAHLLLEEWIPREVPAVEVRRPETPIAIVGMEAHAGPWDSLQSFRERIFGADPSAQPEPPTHWWGVSGDAPSGYYVREIPVRLGRFRIPPKELEAMLPQQLLMLKVAAGAISDAKLPEEGRLRTGVFIGIGLDLNATNFHVRWCIGQKVRDWIRRLGLELSPEATENWTQALRDASLPPLTADRTMGALGGIVASRIAREFRIGGPSFTLSTEESSGLQALGTAMRALQLGDIDSALVGAVDLAGDVRAVLGARTRLPGDGAAAVVLKRLEDARRDGDRIYAIVKGHGVALDEAEARRRAGVEQDSVRPLQGDLKELVGDTGAASGLLSVVKAALCLHHETLPDRRYWLRDRARGPRRAGITSSSVDGNCFHAVLEGVEHESPSLEPVGRCEEVLFALEADDPPALLKQLERLRSAVAQAPDVERLAHRWWHENRPDPRKRLGLALVARDLRELSTLFDSADRRIREGDGLGQDRIFYSSAPRANSESSIAFVFPGSGNHYPGMGREISARWPQIFQAQDIRNGTLRSQLVAEAYWDGGPVDDARAVVLGQVAFGTIMSDLVRSFDVRPGAVIGYSLGESAGLFALGAWKDRDEMLRRVNSSPLFHRELAGACDAVRRAWGLGRNEPVNWSVGVVNSSAEAVRKALRGRKRVYLLIVNTPEECVIGGDRHEVESLVRALAVDFHQLQGVSTVHCNVVKQVQKAYRALHLQVTTPPADVRFYSGAWGRAYEVDRESAADSILAGALQGINFPKVIRTAYDDGVRLFLEMGPGASCTRMIGKILEGRPHLARSACLQGKDSVSAVLRLLGALIAQRVPVDLSSLYGPTPEPPEGGRSLVVPVGGKPFNPPEPPVPVEAPALTAVAEAHAAYLRFSEHATEFLARNIEFQRRAVVAAPAVALERDRCLEFATGSIAAVLGQEYAAIDGHPTRVRLPDEPLMLVDRILDIEGEPRALTRSVAAAHGRVLTEHEIRPGAWYLDCGRIPTCIAVEAGQADLFLCGYLGIDFITGGRAVYRLLDADVTFHRPLPGPGKVIRYDVRIENFFRQGDTHLFRFGFNATVDGEPVLSMRNGCAGFFTAEELAAGEGIIKNVEPVAGKLPEDWEEWVPMTSGGFTDRQIEALRAGDLTACFGLEFERLAVREPVTLPGGRMKLIDRVLELDPTGGRFGLGLIRAEADIHPDDWFLTCHFIDDRVMPGTLMYECCLHTLRVFLLRMGWVGEKVAYEPVPDIAGRLKCRGQVLESTKKVTYEISIKELGYRPEPYAIADALMLADGKPIVEMTDMSLQISGLTKERLRTAWKRAKKPAIFDTDRILAFAVGKPSEAFGEPYRVFDHERIIARLPGPPYQFLDRITEIDAEPWKMVAGGRIEAQFDVPADSWIFASNRQPLIPFSVLLEVALQPCGWMAAYMGSALTSDVDLSFRNLGGTATQHRPVDGHTGTLTTDVRVTSVSTSAGMIIQRYAFTMRDRRGVVYEGTTEFGFFSKQALAQQVGIRDAKLPEPARGRTLTFPREAPFPDDTFRMIDRVDLFVPESFVRGSVAVDPSAWFFRAHFYQDPVWPGSLGLESFLQLLKVVAADRWGGAHFETNAVGHEHRWLYRGQVLPTDGRVTVQAVVTSIDDAQRLLRANGTLSVDGRTIYQMNDFTIRMP